ncbi:MAG: tRNA isopentenyl-2-thiomethyl-A-37 hydroxylase MiaE [Planctomycetota bacterium]|nr:tRNA isopentenyl-2-thiomethyl-A-37 hydroxylase MiaE [Planctomycetota bacterium]MDG1985303.1 tRNA isopentenyl-2-thiomethyl-A-37 hydroxylase MiaE [Planctomycetota bacterium]
MGFPLDHQTPEGWVALVEQEPTRLLEDHAHCELKAASSAHALIAKNPERTELVQDLADIAIEELEHFKVVVAELEARGGRLGEQTENLYAATLHRRSAKSRESLVLDRLVIAHLIEARSLERFHLLAEHSRDGRLRELFAELLPSEAAHQGFYAKASRSLFGRARADDRIACLRQLEGEIMAFLPFSYTVHSGMVGAPELGQVER